MPFISGRHPPSKLGSQNQAASGTEPPLHSLSDDLIVELELPRGAVLASTLLRRNDRTSEQRLTNEQCKKTKSLNNYYDWSTRLLGCVQTSNLMGGSVEYLNFDPANSTMTMSQSK